MASKQFVITAQLNLQPPNMRPVINHIQKSLSSLKLPILNPNFSKSLASIDKTAQQAALSTTRLITAVNNLTAAKAAFNSVSTKTVTINNKVAGAIDNSVRASVAGIRTFPLLTAKVAGYLAIFRELKGVLDFDRALTKLQQTSLASSATIKGIGKDIGNLSAQTGASASNLLEAATVLSQAGKSFSEIREILPTLAKVELGASFEGGAKSAAEAILALSGAFKGIDNAKKYEEILSKVSFVSAKYAVESGDLITAIRKSGSAFSATGSDLNDLLSLFTAVRQSTRLSAGEISNSLKSVSVRLLRKDTQDFLKGFGVDLAPNGQFIGQLKAFQEIAKLINSLPETDTRRAAIIEKVSGSFQFAKVASALQNINLANEVYASLQQKSNQATDEANIRMDSLGGQIDKTTQSISNLFRSLADDNGLRQLTIDALKLTQTLAGMADSIKPLLPMLAILGGGAALRFVGSRVGGAGLALGAGAVGASALSSRGGSLGVVAGGLLGAGTGAYVGKAGGGIGVGIGAFIGALYGMVDALERARNQVLADANLQVSGRLLANASTYKGNGRAQILNTGRAAEDIISNYGMIDTAGGGLSSFGRRLWNGNATEAQRLLDERRGNFAADNAGNVDELQRIRKAIITGSKSYEDFASMFDGAGPRINQALDLLDDGLHNFSAATAASTKAEIEANRKKVEVQAKVTKALEDRAKLEEQIKQESAKYLQAVSKYADSLASSTQERVSQAGRFANIASLRADISGLPQSQRDALKARIAQTQFDAEQSAFGGGNALRIQGRLFAAQEKLRLTPEDDKGRAAIEGTISLLTAQLSRASDGLRHLADSTNAYAVELQTISRLQASQASKLGFAERFLSADQKGRLQLAVENQLAQQAIKAGSLNFAGNGNRVAKQQGAISGLRALGSTLIDGKPADELLEQLIKNTKDVSTFVQQSAAEAKAEKLARDEIARKQQLQLRAQKDLAELQAKNQLEANRVMLIHSKALNDFVAAANPNPKVPGFATGGPISGPSGRDVIPIMATAGEFVVNASASRKNRRLLEAINEGKSIQGFATGGVVRNGSQTMADDLQAAARQLSNAVTQVTSEVKSGARLALADEKRKPSLMDALKGGVNVIRREGLIGKGGPSDLKAMGDALSSLIKPEPDLLMEYDWEQSQTRYKTPYWSQYTNANKRGTSLTSALEAMKQIQADKQSGDNHKEQVKKLDEIKAAILSTKDKPLVVATAKAVSPATSSNVTTSNNNSRSLAIQNNGSGGAPSVNARLIAIPPIPDEGDSMSPATNAARAKAKAAAAGIGPNVPGLVGGMQGIGDRRFRRSRSKAYLRKLRMGALDPSTMRHDDYVFGPNQPGDLQGQQDLVGANVALNRDARRKRMGLPYWTTGEENRRKLRGGNSPVPVPNWTDPRNGERRQNDPWWRPTPKGGQFNVRDSNAAQSNALSADSVNKLVGFSTSFDSASKKVGEAIGSFGNHVDRFTAAVDKFSATAEALPHSIEVAGRSIVDVNMNGVEMLSSLSPAIATMLDKGIKAAFTRQMRVAMNGSSSPEQILFRERFGT